MEYYKIYWSAGIMYMRKFIKDGNVYREKAPSV